MNQIETSYHDLNDTPFDVNRTNEQLKKGENI